MIMASTTSPTTIAPSHRDNDDGEWGSTTTLFTPHHLYPQPPVYHCHHQHCPLSHHHHPYLVCTNGNWNHYDRGLRCICVSSPRNVLFFIFSYLSNNYIMKMPAPVHIHLLSIYMYAFMFHPRILGLFWLLHNIMCFCIRKISVLLTKA